MRALSLFVQRLRDINASKSDEERRLGEGSHMVDHEQRSGLLWPILVSAANKHQPLTYSDAARQLGIHCAR